MDPKIKKVANIFVRISEAEDLKSFSLTSCEEFLTSVSTSLDYSVVNSAFYKFDNGGVTGVLLLRESHVSLHTWPEENFATVEMVTCKDFSSREKEILLDKIKNAFKTEKLDIVVNMPKEV